MKQMRKILFTLLMLPLAVGSYAQGGATGSGSPASPSPAEKVFSFRFVAGDDMFYTPWAGNGDNLYQLHQLVDGYWSHIDAGIIPIHVDGYCTSGESPQESFRIAVIRSNRVKSDLISRKSLREHHFVTKNHTIAYTAPDGKNYRDIVVVTLRIPAEPQPQPEMVEEEPTKDYPPAVEEEPVTVERPISTPQPQPIPEPVVPAKPYCFAVRTNLLYDAFLLPTIGAEWRISPAVGVKFDGSRSWWGDQHGKVQKIWLVNPEARWYMLDKKRFYVGVSANFGEYNIYEGMIGRLFSDDTGYQGKLWSAGLTVGYQLYLSGNFSLDFNLGLGYTRLDYDSFNVTEGVRVYKAKDQPKNFWGPTQAGMNLIWTIGGNR